MKSRRRSLLSAFAFASLASQAACKEEGSDPVEPGAAEPSLTAIAGTCTVETFEIWSANYAVPPAVRLLYDAAANGYVATLRITAASRVSGSYTFSAASRDPYRLGETASGTLTLVEPDSLRFSGASSLPGATHYALAGSLLTLVDANLREVTLTPGSTWQATTRIECRR